MEGDELFQVPMAQTRGTCCWGFGNFDVVRASRNEFGTSRSDISESVTLTSLSCQPDSVLGPVSVNEIEKKYCLLTRFPRLRHLHPGQRGLGCSAFVT